MMAVEQEIGCPRRMPQAQPHQLFSIILTGVVDAKEGRDVMTADIQRAFIQTPLLEQMEGEKNENWRWGC